MWAPTIDFSWAQIEHHFCRQDSQKIIQWPLEIAVALCSDSGYFNTTPVQFTYFPCDPPVSYEMFQSKAEECDQQSFRICSERVHYLPFQNEHPGSHHPITAFQALWEWLRRNQVAELWIKGNDSEADVVRSWLEFANFHRLEKAPSNKLGFLVTSSSNATSIVKYADRGPTHKTIIARYVKEILGSNHTHTGRSKQGPNHFEHCSVCEVISYAMFDTPRAPNRKPHEVTVETKAYFKLLYKPRLLTTPVEHWPHRHFTGRDPLPGTWADPIPPPPSTIKINNNPEDPYMIWKFDRYLYTREDRERARQVTKAKERAKALSLGENFPLELVFH
jgi:hypothetical protein